MLHAMTFAAVLASCQTNGGAGEKSGIDLANLDSTYQPGADFYMYATGGWQKSHPLTDEYSRFGSFDILQENNNKQLRTLIDSVAGQENKPGSIEQKIADLYNSAMDSATLQQHGLDDMAAFLACDGYRTSAEVTAQWLDQVWPRMETQGVDGLFGFYIGADEKDSKNNILTIGQGGLTLGQKDYYVDADPETAKVREA